MLYARDPYKNPETAAYCTAINILAVEHLIKTNNPEEYRRRCKQVSALTEDELVILHIWLDLNKHISTLGAMITQGDYASQLEDLYNFLDYPENRL